MKTAILLVFAIEVAMFGSQAFGKPLQRSSKTNSEVNTEKTDDSNRKQKSPEQQTIEAIRDLIKQELSIQQQSADQGQYEKTKSDQNIDIQWELARYTHKLVWVGGIQGLVLVITAYIFWVQTQTTRTSERAWLKVQPQFNNMTQAPPDGAAIVLYVCSLTNIGKTPATIIETGLAIRITGELGELPQKPIYAQHETGEAGRILAVPADEFALTTTLDTAMTTEQWMLLRKRESFLYTYGFVKYLDAFGIKREFRFCHSYHVPELGDAQPEGFQRAIDVPAEYNRAT